MTQPGLIDRQGLLIWADSRAANSELPRVLRRLILETGRGVIHLGFPAGEGVAAGSWDGTVCATEESLNIPQGLSVWELSVNKNTGTKADADYKKRRTTPDGSPTQECAYVEVILRPWTKRAEWARERTAEGRWKVVRALGVDEIEEWLEAAPITHAWLSEVVGLHPYGLVTAQTWWDTWSSATTPTFPTAAVVAGRDQAISRLRPALAHPGKIVTIRGSSRDEVAAFVAAVALAEEATDEGALLARLAFVDNVETWRRLRQHRTPLVLVALTEQVAAEFVPGSPHVLIVPRTGTSDADVELPPIDAQAAAEILQHAGLQERQAEETGKLARLSLLAARRRLANKRELLRPAWAQEPPAKTVRRVMLIGRWDEHSPADCTIMETVVGSPYEVVREEVASLAAGGDPLLARVGSVVGVVSYVDAWLLLRGDLRQDDFEAFRDAARAVLTEIDPQLELPRNDRWRASLLGKRRLYSPDVRRGLATTLALLGAYGDRPIAGAGITGREGAAWVVRDVLEVANADTTCRAWMSLADVLPLLAEAAPAEFLDAVGTGTIGMGDQPPLLRSMFEDAVDGGNPLAPGSAHTSLLWALERCAWSADYFGRVVDELARLIEIDPGGRLANRPFASLEAILLPWLPQTAVPTEGRLAAIDGLRERHPEVAWRLLLALLPETHDTSMNINEPQFRNWKPERIPVTRQEYWAAIDEIFQRLLSDADSDPARWVALIEKLDDLSPPEREAALTRLHELSNDGSLSPEQRAAIWEALRALVARHREFASAAWALPADEVGAIEATVAQFTPADPLERHRWLFKQESPAIPTVRQVGNFAAYDAALAQARATAAAEIADATNWQGLRDFAVATRLSDIVGAALAQARRYEHEGELLALLGSADYREAIFAAGYFSQRFRNDGWNWLDQHLDSGELSPEQVARLLLYTNDYPKAWEVAEAKGASIATLFWQQFRTHGLGHDFAHVDFVAERLLKANRPGAALDIILLYSHHDDSLSLEHAGVVAQCLEALLRRDAADGEVQILTHHDVVGLFGMLERSGLPRERLAWLEWAYLPALAVVGRPTAITAMLTQDPGFFVDIIRRIFRPTARDVAEEPETASEAEETEQETLDETRQVAIAENAYRLLSEWKDIPGRREDGSVDAEALEAWVTEARAKLRESGHLEVGDSRIGHVLAWGPADTDGSRPCRAVRDLLEKLQSTDVDNGLSVELHNSRGVTTRGLLDGGDQERAIAARYFEEAKQFADQWPRTAALLRKLGESYEQEARPMDDEAERRRTGFDS